MNESFTILFLSDTHIGYPNHELSSFKVFDPLFLDIEKMKKCNLLPNLIVFGGDLAYGELESSSLSKQYKASREWLENLYKALNSTAEEIPIVFAPGNHDMDRIHRNEAEDVWIEGKADKDTVYREMTKQTTLWKSLLSRQRSWAEFLQSNNFKNVYFDQETNSSILKMNIGDHLIGVACLNSSWASYKDKQDSGMWIGRHQIEKVSQQLSDCNFRIAVSHHPTSCINESERQYISQKLEVLFHIHLHGHIHDQWFVDSEGHLKVASGSCYQGAEKENAYSYIVVDFAKKNASIYLRKFEEKGIGAWIPFYIPGKTNSEGIGVIHNLFSREKETTEVNNFSQGNKRIVPSQVIDTPELVSIETIDKFLDVLMDRFHFRVEQNSFASSSNPVVVYWPVRLRRPTPIHAVQCFAAAGLQKLGADIELFLDDLGNLDTTQEEFTGIINKWFSKVGADSSKIKVRLCSQVIANSLDVWNLLRGWYTHAKVDMGEVLEVSKLLTGNEIEKLQVRNLVNLKPRRLMTPAIVWSCFISLCRERNNSRFLTLGGYDECKLWSIWRRKLNHNNNIQYGHLYIPELYTIGSKDSEILKMRSGGIDIFWDAEEDIQKAILQELSSGESSPLLDSPNRLVPWCFSGCYLLPSFVAGKSSKINIDGINITSIEDLKTMRNFSNIVSPLAKCVSGWIF